MASVRDDVMKITEKYIMETYGRYPVTLVRGEGCRVWDSNDREYIDFLSGLAVNSLGHCHPAVVSAIREQAGQLIHVSNLYHIAPQAELAKLLVDHSFAGKAFFANSGAEANEAAIKLARKHAKDRGEPDRCEIVSMIQSFHGRTLATVTATGQKKFHQGFEPLVPGFHYVSFNDISAVEAVVTEKTCAVLVEPVQGEGGIHIAAEGYLPALKKLCRDRGALLIFDEVQCGMGRTGKLFAYEHFDSAPDIMTLAKALGGGVPIGAMLATDEVAGSFVPGTHASTFGGNPLSCAAGAAVMKTLLSPGFLDTVNARSGYFVACLEDLKRRHTVIREIRALGLMIGVELELDGVAIARECLERGFLINCTMGNVLRFLPPLIVSHEEIDALIALLDQVLP
ncbi:MAG: aspartate aminotransferase family protein [Deltaproteobacteria bacterium]|nr:aspartate aminotransferase family protein [Deltaproteobacteria bacterium]